MDSSLGPYRRVVVGAGHVALLAVPGGRRAAPFLPTVGRVVVAGEAEGSRP